MPKPTMPAPTVARERLGPPAERLDSKDEGKEYRLQSPATCAYCGHTLNVARVVHLADGAYSYACQSCAVATNERDQ